MLTQSELKRIWSYDPNTGLLTRLVKSAKRTKVGDVANCLDNNGYIVINFNYHFFRVHRLAFLYMLGKFPKNQVDHINGIPSDNRWCNLRDVTQKINKQNLHAPKKNNSSGYLGVSKSGKKWVATISIDSKTKYIGTFDCKKQAHNAYLIEKRKNHKGCDL